MSALDDALAKIGRTWGQGAVMRLGDEGAIAAVEAISTRSIQLDKALGIGGLARGRIVEVFGPESSGKTTLVLHVLAEAQSMGLSCAFIDAEHALDPTYAEALGCRPDELLVSQPDYGEQALNIAHDLIETGEVGVVAIDSVAALTPKKELDGEIGDTTVGLQARMMSQAMRKLAAVTNQTQTLLIFTNQIREKVGVMFGSPETQPGGRALKFYATQRLDVRRLGSDGAKGEETLNRVRVTVKKNKVAPPFRIAELELVFGVGFDQVGELLDLGVAQGLVSKSGGWHVIEGEKANGRDAAKALLAAEPALMERIRTAALAA